MKLIEWILSLFGTPKVEGKPAGSGVMRLSADGFKLLRYYEGLELEAYRDTVGVLTIGYGDTQNVTEGMVITEADAEVRLRNRLSRDFEPGVMAAVSVPLTQNQFDALVCFTYNVGVGAFKGSTLLKKLNSGDYAGAANELPRWNKAGGKPLRGLTLRRESERKLFLGQGHASSTGHS